MNWLIQIDFFKNCFMYNKIEKQFFNFNASKSTKYLSKKIKLVFESDDIKDKEKIWINYCKKQKYY